MKRKSIKYYLLIIFIIHTSTVLGQDEGYTLSNDWLNNVEIFAGFNFSKISGQYASETRGEIDRQKALLGDDYQIKNGFPPSYGFELGAQYVYKINEHVSAISGLNLQFSRYTQRLKIVYNDPRFRYDETQKVRNTIKQTYLTIPLMARYQFNQKLSFQGGLLINMALSGNASLVTVSKTEVEINGEFDDDWSQPWEKDKSKLNEETHTVVPGFMVAANYQFTTLFSARAGLLVNGKHFTIQNKKLSSIGFQLTVFTRLNAFLSF